ncbi:MAG TPA: hypothetical protein VGQ31_05360 [Candidatus Limnocylindrales bacterium]|nr:hypothetical protein [Candidatus Limnocylindrales bacterium]
MHRLRRRHATASAAGHAHARQLAADRLGSPLGEIDETWLDHHLAGCPACRSVAAGYEADRLALRAMRDHQPEAPRDLWARTAAALERESAAAGGARRRPVTGRSWRSGPLLGVASGVAVIALVIGVSALSGAFVRVPATGDVPGPSALPVAVASPVTPGPTPITVGAGSVGWVGTSPDGDLAYNVTPVSQVCPADRQPDCAPVADSKSKAVHMNVRPKSISQSPVRNQAVVVGTDAKGDDSVLVIALPTAEPTATPAPTVTPAATPNATPTAVSAPPTSAPTASAETTPTPTPTATAEPTPAVTPSPSPTATATPAPTLVRTLAIVSDVKVVGESAAFSPDGAWFAFTARPADDSAGPDIYVWHVGDDLARPVTTDHLSVFASWVGGLLVGSRPGAAGSTEVEARSFLLDPATGRESDLSSPAWRPVVDPAGDRAVTWVGTVRLGDDGLTSVPATGSLVLRGFNKDAGPEPTDSAETVVADGPISEFDVRWDETGSWLAVWIADPTDPGIGRLSLLHLDDATGTLDRPHGAPQDVTALPGFSIADKRLAWATPPGQGGEGSRVQIVAWTDDTVGAVESNPVEGVVVVH